MNNKFFSVLIMLIFSWGITVRCFGQLSDIRQAFVQSRALKRDIFVYLHATWCAPCRELEKEVLPRGTVKDSLKNYVFLSLSIDESNDGKAMAKKYGVTYVPAFILLSPEGFLRHYTTGVPVDTASFLQLLSSYRKKEVVKGYSNNMEMKYPDFYEQYFTVFPRQEPDTIAVMRYMEVQPGWEDEISFNILSNLRVGKKYISYFLNHEKAYVDRYGPLYYDRVYQSYHSFAIARITGDKDTAMYKLYDKVLSSIDSMRGYDKARLSLFRYIEFLGKTGIDWNKYLDAVDVWMGKYGTLNLRGFCEDISKKCTNVVVCKAMAEHLTKYLASGEDQNENAYLVCAILLHRAGMDREAVKAYRRALKFPADEEKKKYIEDEWHKFQ